MSFHKKSKSYDSAIKLRFLETAPSDDEISVITPTNSELISEGFRTDLQPVHVSPVHKTAASIPDWYSCEAFTIQNLDSGEVFDLRQSDVQSMLNRDLSMGFEAEVERALWYAASSNDVKQCKHLLKMYDADMNYINHGTTALQIASLNGYTKTVQILLDYSKRVDLDQMAKFGQTLLHLACISSSLQLIQLLIRSGAKINVQDINGDTPLHLLVQYGDTKAIKWLIDKGAKLYVNNYWNMKPIDMTKKLKIRQFLQDLMIPIHKTLAPRDFVIKSVLGRGSFGKVYLVEHDDNLYAMKVLDKEIIKQRDIMRYVMAEKKVLSTVNHPFIVKLYHAFQNNDKLFLVMDYCPGGDLSLHLKREKRFNEHKARCYICEVILAIEELHKHNVIYRDLKPDNLVVDKRGNTRLCDFGLSKLNVNDEENTHSFWGSVAYLPPEILNKSGHGKAVDWYLIGALLYEFLIGHPPYYAKSKEAIFKNIRSAPLPFPPNISPEAKDFIKKLLNRNPAKRLVDPEVIKSHSFFADVDWKCVYHKLVRMPKNTKIRYALAQYDTDNFEDSIETSDRVGEWSFNNKL